MNYRRNPFTFLTLLLCGMAPYLLPAQTGDDAPELDPIEAKASSSEDLLEWSEAPATSITGSARSLLETPRAATSVPEVFRDAFAGEGLETLFSFAPGVAKTSQFGHVTTPTIRGDVGEFYIQGQRRSNNQYGFKPSLNAFDSFLVLRGPPSLVLGPGFHSGGAVLALPKQPRLDVNRVHVEAELGGLALEGDAWFDGRIQVDLSRVLREDVAGVRISYEGRGNETFLDSPAAADDTHSLYGSYRWENRGGWSGFVAGELYWENAPQLLGVNRPSPSLFQSNAYIRGEGGFADFGAGPVFVVNPPATGPDRIDLARGASLLSSQDQSRARVGWLQSEFRWDGPVPFVNRTFVEGVDRERVHEFEYFEFVEQFTLENRSEWQWKLPLASRVLETTAGFSLRLEQRESFVNFFNEYPVAFDISGGARRFRVREQYPGLIVPGLPGPEGLEFFGLPFSPETTESELWNPALFWESTMDLNPQWQVIGGLRLDGYLAEARDPITPDGASDTDSLARWSGSLSLIYQPGETSSFYFTLADTNAVEGSIAGGGIMLNASGVINRDNLENRSRLVEMGWKQQFDERLELGISAYRQTRRRIEIRGPRSDLLIQGLELEGKWSLPGQGYGFANLTWTDGEYQDSAPSQLGGRSLYDLYAPGFGPDNQGTGVGYDFFFTNQVPAGDYPLPGLSPWSANLGLTWEPGDGHRPGFRLWTDYQDAQPGNLDQEYFIPVQWVVNAGLDFQWRDWILRLDALNLFDEAIWRHNGGTFFNNQLVTRGPPARLRLRIKKTF